MKVWGWKTGVPQAICVVVVLFVRFSTHSGSRFWRPTTDASLLSVQYYCCVLLRVPVGPTKVRSFLFVRSISNFHQGYIPIAFVANFPGVARFGVELQDISAGILASDMLQVCPSIQP